MCFLRLAKPGTTFREDATAFSGPRIGSRSVERAAGQLKGPKLFTLRQISSADVLVFAVDGQEEFAEAGEHSYPNLNH